MAPPSATAPGRLRIGVVEDDALTRATLVSMLADAQDLRVVLVAANRAEALALRPQCALDVLLVDLGLPDGSGLDVIRATRLQWPDCSILVSTIFGDDSHVLRSIEAGGRGQRHPQRPVERVPDATALEAPRQALVGCVKHR